MTYALAGLIEANDYNQRIAGTALGTNVNVNYPWGAGATDKGYGQSSPLSNVSVGGTVTATNWASMLTNLRKMANHQNTSVGTLPGSGPTAGDTVTFLTSLDTVITNVYNNVGSAVAVGSENTTFSGTSSRTANWSSTLTFTHTITWSNANALRYWFNAGGYVRWRCNKSSSGQTGDPEWNDLGTKQGDIRFTGGTGTRTIAGTNYTGTTRIGGSGSPSTHLTTTGWYDLTTSPVTVWQLNADTSPYTGNYIRITLATAGSGTQLVITTTWVNTEGDPVTGGTATNSPFSSFGTGPATIVTTVNPSTTYLSDTWGTPTIAAAISGS